ncbi:MAG: hypothetical protein K9G76_04510 [Bacteroidales bacterium]|nr:hypothetical protein [Bacteroidales bacterium]MCF8403687.1 hypothetical protein [Bacteroidales bacterium]
MKSIYLLLAIGLITLNGFGQSNEKLAPTLIQQADWVIEVPSIASQIESGEFIPGDNLSIEINPKRRDANKAVPGKGLPKGVDPLWQMQNKNSKIKGKEPILTFTAASSGTTPTDPTGAVGPNHFVNSWNSAFRIWDKAGNALTPVASLSTIFPGETAGDPIVIYDHIADRFIVTEFTFQNGFLVAVSQGPDPVSSGWYTYYFSTNSFPDYPKFSLWSDGYYITANKNSSSAGSSQVVFAIERDKMLTGDPSAMMIGFPLPSITTSGFYSPLGFNVNGNEMPPPGNAPIVYMQDDSWSGVSTDHLKIWSINVDWDTPGNSSISSPQIISTTPFDGLFDGGSFSNLPQPSGPDIDALQATIMYMAQYRRFSNYNSVVFNFVVDLNGSDNYAGIRWYELRQPNDGDPWEIYQEGTYSQPDGHSAFSGNMCMDAQGNIALAYTIVSNSQYPSLRYTGRFSSDPPGLMTIAEDSYAEGTQSDPSTRYGDYSQMTIDPTDDLTFWSIGEYFTGGSRKNQVGVFKIAPELANDVGIVSIESPENGILSNSEPVTVTLRNFGIDQQVDIPVSYQIDEGTMVNELYSGTLASNEEVDYTFATTGDFSIPGAIYHIHAATNLISDQNIENDTISVDITHLFANDLGITSISSPVSGSYLSDDEIVTATIYNYGVSTQQDFNVSYKHNNASPVTEQVTGPLAAGETIDYSFTTPVDLSDIGEHEIKVMSALAGDENYSNDTTTVMVINSLCQPELLCTQGVGVWALELGSILNESGCDPGGYGNYTDMSTDLAQGSSNDMIITTGYGNVFVKTWIDFNDNFLYEENEIVINDFEIADGQGAGTYTETLPLEIPVDASMGEHFMRIKLNYNEGVPADPCEATIFGETEDYMVNIILGTGFKPTSIETNELVLINKGKNEFSLSYSSDQQDETLIVTVHNIQGQKLIENRIIKVSGTYTFDFDMSYAPQGIYLLRLGNQTFGKIKKFTVR